MNIKRRPSKKIKVGKVEVGDFSSIKVQSMCTTKAVNIEETVAQINELEQIGCDIVRIDIGDNESAEAISKIKKEHL